MVTQPRRPVTVGPARTNAHHRSVAVVSNNSAARCANLDAHRGGAVAEVGQDTARRWRLYMAGSRLGFDRNHIELHQVLGVKLQPDGTSGMPLRPDWEIPRVLAS